MSKYLIIDSILIEARIEKDASIFDYIKSLADKYKIKLPTKQEAIEKLKYVLQTDPEAINEAAKVYKTMFAKTARLVESDYSQYELMKGQSPYMSTSDKALVGILQELKKPPWLVRKLRQWFLFVIVGWAILAGLGVIFKIVDGASPSTVLQEEIQKIEQTTTKQIQAPKPETVRPKRIVQPKTETPKKDVEYYSRRVENLAYDQYKSIKVGMTYKEVRSILKARGIQNPQNETLWQWHNAEDVGWERIDAYFYNNQLKSIRVWDGQHFLNDAMLSGILY